MPKKAIPTKADNKDFERIASGIPGLDKLIEGGFVKGSTVLVSGGAGTGKTIFCVQYLMEGLKRGENCMFITLEEKPENIINDVKRFGWDLEKYMNDKKLILEYQDPFQMIDITAPLLDKIKEYDIQRVAIDSTSIFEMYYKEPSEIRKQLFKLITGLEEAGTTNVITSELPERGETLGKFGVEEFISDGVIKMEFIGLGGSSSFNIQVRKMRRTNHVKESFPYDITDEGIKISKL